MKQLIDNSVLVVKPGASSSISQFKEAGEAGAVGQASTWVPGGCEFKSRCELFFASFERDEIGETGASASVVKIGGRASVTSESPAASSFNASFPQNVFLGREDCAGTSSPSFSVDWQSMPAMSTTLAALLGDCLPSVSETCDMILAEVMATATAGEDLVIVASTVPGSWGQEPMSFLGIEVDRPDPNTRYVSKEAYTREILLGAGFSDCLSVMTPTKVNKIGFVGPKFLDLGSRGGFRKVNGELQCLLSTRLDCCFVVASAKQTADFLTKFLALDPWISALEALGPWFFCAPCAWITLSMWENGSEHSARGSSNHGGVLCLFTKLPNAGRPEKHISLNSACCFDLEIELTADSNALHQSA